MPMSRHIKEVIMKNKDGCSFCCPAFPENLFSLDFSEEENCWYIISCLIPAKIEAKYCPKCGRKLPLKK